MPSKQLMRNTLDVWLQRKALKARLKEINKEYEELSEELIAQFIDDGISGSVVCGEDDEGKAFDLATIKKVEDTYAGYLDADDFHSYLAEHDLDSMRKVNTQTLTAWFNKEAPDEVREDPAAIGLKVATKSSVRVYPKKGTKL